MYCIVHAKPWERGEGEGERGREGEGRGERGEGERGRGGRERGGQGKEGRKNYFIVHATFLSVNNNWQKVPKNGNNDTNMNNSYNDLIHC